MKTKAVKTVNVTKMAAMLGVMTRTRSLHLPPPPSPPPRMLRISASLPMYPVNAVAGSRSTIP